MVRYFLSVLAFGAMLSATAGAEAADLQSRPASPVASDYGTAVQGANARYKAALQACKPQSGARGRACVRDAKGDRSRALADARKSRRADSRVPEDKATADLRRLP